MVLYLTWLSATALALLGAWAALFFLQRREAFAQSVLQLLRAPLAASEPAAQLASLCEVARREARASSCEVFLHDEELGEAPDRELPFRRVARAGAGGAVALGPLAEAWRAGRPGISQEGSRTTRWFPFGLGASGGGVLCLTWEGRVRAGRAEEALGELAAQVGALVAPRLWGEQVVARSHQELEALRREAAEEARLAGVGRLAAGVAHELNTPLGAVLTMISSLARSSQDPAAARRLVIVRDALEKCKGVIEKLLVDSRGPARGSRGLSAARAVRSLTQLNSVLEESLELMAEGFAERGIRVRRELGELPPVRVQVTQWSHVFNNLLINARDALSTPGVVEPELVVSSAVEGGRIRFEVADNGPGVPPEIREHLFEPFFTTRPVGEGTGLGLAIVREVVRKHQGSVELVEGQGPGARFRLELPLDASGGSS